jgi:hypothetical protein
MAKMKTILESDEFRAELPGWVLRGVLCAASSAAWAALLGFQAPAEIAGMVAGVAFWVAVFAALCAWRPGPARWNQPQAVAALKWAAWIKVGFTAFGWLVFAAGGMLNLEGLSQMGMLGMVDLLLGLAALAVVSFAAGLKGAEMVATADSFGWTALTTVIEGALVALMIASIALCVWAAWRIWPLLKAKGFSPARLAG